MMDEFMMLLPDAIGTVQYKWESKNLIPQKQKDAYIDGYTNEVMHVMVQKAMYDPSSVPDISIEFSKARDAARKLLEDSGMETIIKSTQLQIGNQECLDFVLKISSHPNFKGWVNEPLVNAFILETKIILKNKQNKG